MPSKLATTSHSSWMIILSVALLALLGASQLVAEETAGEAQEASDEEFEELDSASCVGCHMESDHDTLIEEDLAHSIHEGVECLDCHQDRDTYPHQEMEGHFAAGCEGCRTCHIEAAEQYTIHGRETHETCGDIPQCSDCHGSHEILHSDVKHIVAGSLNRFLTGTHSK